MKKNFYNILYIIYICNDSFNIYAYILCYVHLVEYLIRCKLADVFIAGCPKRSLVIFCNLKYLCCNLYFARELYKLCDSYFLNEFHLSWIFRKMLTLILCILPPCSLEGQFPGYDPAIYDV
jgi:hypothetical protein